MTSENTCVGTDSQLVAFNKQDYLIVCACLVCVAVGASAGLTTNWAAPRDAVASQNMRTGPSERAYIGTSERIAYLEER